MNNIIEKVDNVCAICKRATPSHVGIGYVRNVGLVCATCATCGLCSMKPISNHLHYIPELQIYTHKIHRVCYKCTRTVIRWSDSDYDHRVDPGTIIVDVHGAVDPHELLCTICRQPCSSKCCPQIHRPINGVTVSYGCIEPDGSWYHSTCMPYHGD